MRTVFYCRHPLTLLTPFKHLHINHVGSSQLSDTLQCLRTKMIFEYLFFTPGLYRLSKLLTEKGWSGPVKPWFDKTLSKGRTIMSTL